MADAGVEGLAEELDALRPPARCGRRRRRRRAGRGGRYSAARTRIPFWPVPRCRSRCRRPSTRSGPSRRAAGRGSRRRRRASARRRWTGCRRSRVLVIIASSFGSRLSRASRHARGEAERPDLDTRGGAEDEAVGLVARVLGEGAEAGGGIAREGASTRRRSRPRSRPRPRPSRRRRPPGSRAPGPRRRSPATQGRSQEPPGKCSGVGGMTRAPGPSVARSGAIGSGRSCSASISRSSAWIASSVARYSPSPKWAQASEPPRLQRKRLGQPSQP